MSSPSRTSALFAALLAAAGAGHAQFLSQDPWSGEREFLNKEYHPLWEERYENYSLNSYRDYGESREAPLYDPFGIYLVDGLEILRVQETRTLNPIVSSSASWNLGRFRNMVILRDDYRGWGSRFMMGDLLDGHFSPLTLNLARLEGFRWDASSHRNRFSTVISRAPRPLSANRFFSHYLFGGHWESRLGDVVTFGATYVNFHLQDSQRRGASLRGNVPTRLEPASSYYVIVSDDSPEDAIGPRVFDIQVVAHGRVLDIEPDVRLLPASVFDGTRRTTLTVDPAHAAHVRRDGAWAPRIPEADRVLRVDERTRGRRGRFFTHGVPVPPDSPPLEVTGTDLLIYRFEVPGVARDLRWRLQVSGDYSIDVGASYGFQGGGEPRWDDWHNVARAAGNVTDGSNLAWVTVDYGFPTGLAQYGSNLTVKWLGATVDAAYVLNEQRFQFPHDGSRHDTGTGAWYARMSRKARGWRLGLEYVDVPASFETSMPVWLSGGNKLLRYDLVEDNDDGDEWPDVVEHWDVLDPAWSEVFRSSSDPDPDAKVPQTRWDYQLGGGRGVFPGLDADDDATVDVNVNRNQIPDYAEPFFMYGAEPDEFVYGDDFNNNGVVDERENDNKPDYPYDRDQRGYHALLGLEPVNGLDLVLGRYHMRQRAGGGRNEVTYAEVGHLLWREGTGRLRLQFRIRRVRDDIRNPVYQHAFDQTSRAEVVYRLRPDALLMTNSLVHTAFLESRYTGVRGLSIVNAAKYERNARRGGAGEVPGHVREYALVSKADYAWVRGSLTVSPMAKLMWLRREAPGRLLSSVDVYDLFPILRADYRLSSRTVLRAGVQGLPGFRHTHRNRKAAGEDFDARHYLAAVQTTGNYTGYDVSVNLGVRSTRSTRVSLPGEPLERFTEFFIQVRAL